MSVYAIVTPILNDWDSFLVLLDRLRDVPFQDDIRFDIVAVDDGSQTKAEVVEIAALCRRDPRIRRMDILHLALNLGHQRAIATGLVELSKRNDIDGILVMDSDGEDRPEDVFKLIAAARSRPGQVIFARRSKRSEGSAFKVGYLAYKALFRVVVGKEIAFGNFSYLPIPAVRRLVYMPELWNNLPASVIRSRIGYGLIDTERGTRYAGSSHMNLPNLVAHGFSAMAVYADLMFVRMLIGSLLVGLGAVLLAGVVTAIRVATSLAIPGWATVVFGNLMIVLLISLLVSMATTVTVLSARSMRSFVPVVDAPIYVAHRDTVFDRDLADVAANV